MNSENNKTVLVTNRSRSVVIYSLKDPSVRRRFAPGQTFKIPVSELEALTYIPGGIRLIQRNLLIKDEEVVKEMPIKAEPEYWMEKDEIIKLLQEGSIESFLDCLDFAPAGVIELIKELAVSLPLTDTRKREAIREKTGLDVDKALIHLREVAEATENSEKTVEEAPQRRVKVEETSTRRTTPSYKVVSKGE